MFFTALSAAVLLLVLVHGQRKGNSSTVVLVTCLVALGAAAWGWNGTHTREAAYERASEPVAGRELDVSCDGIIDNLTSPAPFASGYVPYEDGDPNQTGRKVFLSSDICDALRSYRDLGDKGAFNDEQMFAVHVLAHEAVHVSGQRDEARAECVAVQVNSVIAQGLGASPAQAQALSVAYWSDGYPRMRESYRSSKCGPGQDWDEGLNPSPW